MTKRRRIAATLKGEKVDRVSVSAWMHFPLQDRTVAGQIQAFLDFQQKYDWDFMKLMFRSTFPLEDWGCWFEDYQRPLGYWEISSNAVNSPEDWKKLEVLDPKKGVLGEMLEVVAGLKKQDLFKLATVFVPFMVARQLSGDRLQQDIKDHPAEVHRALEVITETMARFAVACLDSGAEGIFFATQTARTDYMSVQQYREFGRPYDLRVLEAIEGRSQFTMMHICGAHIMFDEFLNYPVDAYNWDDRHCPLASRGSQKDRQMLDWRDQQDGCDSRG